jgi:DNA repair exonuclease SbcCD ATPase subunit
MAKRSTIGKNPLDARLQENPLDTVVPDLTIAARGAGQAAAALSELEKRLTAMEEALAPLKTEVAGAGAAAAAAQSLKGLIVDVQEELARLRQELEQLKANTANGSALAADLAQLKEELAKVRAGAAPADLPFWMRGRKK